MNNIKAVTTYEQLPGIEPVVQEFDKTPKKYQTLFVHVKNLLEALIA